MNKAIVLVLLLVFAAAQDSSYATTTSSGCICNGCPPSGSGVPVNQPIVVVTPPTIAPPACAIPTITPPVIAPPQVCIPVINAPCINVPTLTPPSVVAPPTVTPPTPIIPVVTPPAYTPPSLPQVPVGCTVPPTGPIITLPTPPPSNANCGVLSNKFTLTFEYACRPNVAIKSCLGTVVFNNAIVFTIIPSADYSWNTTSVQVTVQPGSNSLQFVGAGISDSYGLLIDNIKLVRQGTTANIVVNGDFSSPNEYGSWNIHNNIIGWLGIGIEIGYGPYVYGSGSSQVCELDGNGNYEITQYFTFNNQFQQISNGNVASCKNPFPGSSLTYKLEFDWAVRSTYGSAPFDTSMGNVIWNNNVLDSLYYGKENKYFGGINHASYVVILGSGDNVLSFDGTSFSDSYGLTIDNVKLTSVYSSNNLIVNGDFATPYVGSSFIYKDNGITGWSAVRAEVGYGTLYNANWNGPVIELDSDSNQRYTQVITISQNLYSQLLIQVQQSIKNAQVYGATNLAINNAQNSLNNQMVAINQAVQCKINMVANQFNSYIQNLYQCNSAAIQNVQSNQYVTVSQYSCGDSEWLQYFGQSGELDF
jgi:hypothetical protein